MFLQPLLLLAAAGAVVPVVLHLIYRRRAQEIPFGSLKFLKTSQKRTAHRKRLQELLLLAVRVGLILALALALAKPLLGAVGRPGSRSYTSAVLVLDDSGSMTCEANGVGRFARAKAAAAKVLGTFGPGDGISLRRACRPVPQRAGEVTTDRAAVADELAKADCTAARGELAAQMVAGLKELSRRLDPNRELFVATDMQRNALAPLASALASAADPRVAVVFLDCSDQDYRNAAVTDLAVRTRTRAAGEPATVQARVQNTSAKQVAAVAALFVDGQKVAEEHLDLEPGEVHTASLPCRMEGAGAHWGLVELSADSMPFDNRRYFQTELFRRVPVLVVEESRGPAAPAGAREGSFYLLRALDPYAETGGRSLIEPRLVEPAAAAARLPGQSAVLLSGLERIAPELGQALRDYVAAGGGLIVFPAAAADAAGYEAAFGDRGDGRGRLLPAKLGPLLALPKPKEGEEAAGLEIAGLDFTHQVLLPFKGLPRASGFGGVRVRAARRLEIPAKSGAQELISFKNAEPFLVTGAFGRGRVYLFACPADPAASNLAIQAAFPPLLHEMVYDLAEVRERRTEFLLGGTATLAFPEGPAGLAVRVASPGGRTVDLKAAGPENSVSFGPLDEAGLYRFKALPAGREGGFVTNPDPDESDLTPMSRAEITKLFRGFKSVTFVDRAEDAPQAVARLREGRDLSGLLLGLVLALTVFECFFANWMTAGKRLAAKAPAP